MGAKHRLNLITHPTQGMWLGAGVGEMRLTSLPR